MPAEKIPIEKINSDATINLALDTIQIGEQALIFTNTKRSAEKTAEDISLKIKECSNELDEISEKILHAISKPTKQCERLARCIKKGIAFHHAGLTHKQKEIIEDSFREGRIKIIACTPSLALGVDLPAFRSILKDLRRYGHHGLDWIPTLEYLQMAGRAGRPKFDKYGEAIAVALTEEAKKEIYERYIRGYPEDIFSKLAVEPVLRTYLLSLIATRVVADQKSIIKFFSGTFWAFQYRDMSKLSSIILKMLRLLEEFKFIKSSESKEEFQSAAEMFNNNYTATAIGKRVAELYIDPLTAYYLITCIKSAFKKKTNSFSFLQMISHTLEMRPLLRARTKEYDLIEKEIIKNSDNLLENEPSIYEPEYEEFLNSVKTALFFSDWINEKDEEYLLENYNIRPGEIRVKLELADWLLYASEELTRMLRLQKIIKEIVKLRLRLKHGVKEELLPLLRLEGIGRVRARKLFNNKIKDISDVKKADASKLAGILGEKIALSVKEQVGQKIKAVPKGKRKGQTSIKKF
jgi:helicase